MTTELAEMGLKELETGSLDLSKINYYYMIIDVTTKSLSLKSPTL